MWENPKGSQGNSFPFGCLFGAKEGLFPGIETSIIEGSYPESQLPSTAQSGKLSDGGTSAGGEDLQEPLAWLACWARSHIEVDRTCNVMGEQRESQRAGKHVHVSPGHSHCCILYW